MMSPSDGDRDLVRRYIIRPLSVTLLDASLHEDHTQSVHFRQPSFYDRHLHPRLRLEHVSLDLRMIDNFKSLVEDRALRRPSLLEQLRKQPAVPTPVTSAMWAFKSAHEPVVVNEASIVEMSNSIMRGCRQVATLVLFDRSSARLDAEESGSMPPYFAYRVSSESETQADYLVELLSPDNRAWDPPAREAALRYSSIGVFLGLELKNIIASDPRIFLSIMLLVALTLDDPTVVFPWPDITCKACGNFAASHRYLDSSVLVSSTPRDAASSPTPPDTSQNTNKETLQLHEDLNFVIRDLQRRISDWDELVADDRQRKTSATSTPSIHKESVPLTARDAAADLGPLTKTMKAIETIFDKYNIDNILRSSVKGWLKHAIDMTVQAWSRMVRHNTTFHLITSYQVSWILRRHRNSSTATFSNFFFPGDDKIALMLTGVVIRAYEDACERFDESSCVAWTEPFKKKSSSKHSGKRKRADREKEDGEKPEKHLSDKDVSASNKKRRQESPAPTLPPYEHFLNLTSLHLAFRTATLWSDAFSCFQRSLDTQGSLHDDSKVPSCPRQPWNETAKSKVSTSVNDFTDASFSTTRSSGTLASSSSTTKAAAPSFHAKDSPQLADPCSPEERLRTCSKAGIFLDTLLAKGAVGIVWGGHMVVEDAPHLQRRVAVKITNDDKGGERLHREGKVYRYLANVTPQVGPRCYGVFTDGTGTAALVLDYLGTPLERFEDSDYHSIDIYNQALSLHAAGIYHADLEPRNVLVDDDDKVHIIDFHVSEVHHQCLGPGNCDELDVLAHRLGIRHPDTSH